MVSGGQGCCEVVRNNHLVIYSSIGQQCCRFKGTGPAAAAAAAGTEASGGDLGSRNRRWCRDDEFGGWARNSASGLADATGQQEHYGHGVGQSNAANGDDSEYDAVVLSAVGENVEWGWPEQWNDVEVNADGRIARARRERHNGRDLW